MELFSIPQVIVLVFQPITLQLQLVGKATVLYTQSATIAGEHSGAFTCIDSI